MTVRTISLGGTDWADGEVLYAADLNDTVSGAVTSPNNVLRLVGDVAVTADTRLIQFSGLNTTSIRKEYLLEWNIKHNYASANLSLTMSGTAVAGAHSRIEAQGASLASASASTGWTLSQMQSGTDSFSHGHVWVYSNYVGSPTTVLFGQWQGTNTLSTNWFDIGGGRSEPSTYPPSAFGISVVAGSIGSPSFVRLWEKKPVV